jgi:hypothetical protein
MFAASGKAHQNTSAASCKRYVLIFRSCLRCLTQIERNGQLLPMFVGAFVATACFAKAYQSFANPLIETLQTSIEPWFRVSLIGSEIAFGAWLCCGLLQRQTRKVAIALFLVYLAVSFYYAISGKASCGCFGDVPLHPWLTAAMDAVVVFALVRWQPHVACERGQNHRLGRLIVISVSSGILLVMVALTATLFPVKQARIDEDGAINGQGVVLLEPQMWVGKRLPLLPYVKTG